MERRYLAFGLAAVVVAGATAWRQAHERHGFAWRPVATTADGRVLLDTNTRTGDAWTVGLIRPDGTAGGTTGATIDCGARRVNREAAAWVQAAAPALVAVACDSTTGVTAAAARP